MSRRKKRLHDYIQHSRQLDFDVQSLEQRQLLAGNVTAVINAGGDLSITGDNSANEIDVDINVFGDVTITGLNGTMVDDSQIVDSQVTGDIKVDLKNGDNVLNLVSTTNTDLEDVSIKTGNGADDITIENTNAEGGFVLSSGDGSDTVVVENTSSGKNASVALGGGNDELELEIATGDFEDNPKRNLKVSATSGDNSLTFNDVYASGRLSIRTGKGNDSIFGYSYGKYNATLNTGGGDDMIEHGIGSLRKATSVITGSGNDTFNGQLKSFYGSAKLTTGSGDDMVFMYGEARKLTVSTGSGNDTLEIDEFSFDAEGQASGRIALGGGNDTLITGSGIAIPIKASGSGGTDAFSGDSSFLSLTSFEDIEE